MSWEEDKQFSEGARIYQDKLYKMIFPLKNITRFSKEDRHILDKNYHTDVELEINNGIKLLGQEKALRKKFGGFDTFTIEFYQNRFTKESGEFFNLGAQFYCHGYMNGNNLEETTGFEKVYIINIFDFLEQLKKHSIKELEYWTRPSPGLASFYHIEYKDIPDKFIYFKFDTAED